MNRKSKKDHAFGIDGEMNRYIRVAFLAQKDSNMHPW